MVEYLTTTFKKCNKCKVAKPESEFTKHKEHRDGLATTCKECKKKYDKRRYKENKQEILAKKRDRYNTDEQYKQHIKDQKKQWRENNPEKTKLMYEKNREKHFERQNAYCREYHRKHPKEKKAQNAVKCAVKTGKITRPERCVNCNTVKPLDGHHEDYDKPLAVIWLCKSCHKQLHFAAMEG